jgi:hypothetical protein
MSIFPRNTNDTTACEAVMDLQTGIGILVDHMETLAKSIVESDDDNGLMHDMQPVFWLALRLQNDIADVLEKVEALPRPRGAVELAEAAE